MRDLLVNNWSMGPSPVNPARHTACGTDGEMGLRVADWLATVCDQTFSSSQKHNNSQSWSRCTVERDASLSWVEPISILPPDSSPVFGGVADR